MQIQFVYRKPSRDSNFPMKHRGLTRGDLEEKITQELEASLALLGKKGRCQVSLSISGHQCRLEVKVMSGWGYFQASGEKADFISAIHAVGIKLDRQVTRVKERLTYHHNPERNPQVRLKELAEFSSVSEQKAA